MKRGEIIRYLREWRSDTRRELAKRAEISEDYLKKIETGRRQLGKIETLRKLAVALGVDVELLLSDVNELALERELQSAGLAGEIQKVTVLHNLTLEDDDAVLRAQLGNPERLIAYGDAADARGEWEQAIEYYLSALNLLPKDYRWTRYAVERLTQMHINRWEFSDAQSVLSEVKQIITEWPDSSINRALIEGLIAEKQGWIENFRGKHSVAQDSFRRALSIAQRWGDKRLESTSNHFLGRSEIEAQLRITYPRLLTPATSDSKALQRGLAAIQEALRMDDGSEPNVGFGLHWEGLGLLLLGNYYDAMGTLERSVILLEGIADSGPQIDRLRIEALLTKSRNDYDDIIQALSELLYQAAQEGHPHSFVRVAVSYLYVKYLADRHAKSATERRKCTDLSLVSLLLYLEPQHLFVTVLTKLLSQFIVAMSISEFVDYRQNLPYRIIQFADSFSVLRNFQAPNLLRAHSMLELVDLIGRKEGKAET